MKDYSVMEPQKYWAYTKEDKADYHLKLLNTPGYIAKLKKDGEWSRLIKDNDGQVIIQSRSISKVTGRYGNKTPLFPHIVEWAERELPNNTVILGELYIPGWTSTDVGTICRCKGPKAIERQKKSGNWMKFSAFDVLAWDGYEIDLEPAYVRNNHLHINLKNTPRINEIEICETWMTPVENPETFVEKLFEQGEEGIVLEKLEHKYEPGLRTARETVKIKQEDSYDLIITRTLAPNKEYNGTEIEGWQYWEGEVAVTKPYFMGWIGSIVCSAYVKGKLVEICSVSSGLTDELKKAISEDFDKYNGQVVEIVAMGRTKDGSLRQPRLKRLRHDKPAEDCKF